MNRLEISKVRDSSVYLIAGPVSLAGMVMPNRPSTSISLM